MRVIPQFVDNDKASCLTPVEAFAFTAKRLLPARYTGNPQPAVGPNTLLVAALFEKLNRVGPQPSSTDLWTLKESGERHVVSDSRLRQVAAKTSLFLATNAGY